MCNEQQIFNIDFSATNDEFNWLVQNNSVAIATVDGKLKIKADNQTSSFTRDVGSIDGLKNRIRLRSNLILAKPANSTNNTIKVWFAIYAGSTLIDEFSVYRSGLASGDNVLFNLDRVYSYSGVSGNISLKIRFTEGFQNHILLKDMVVDNFEFCEQNIRTHFIVDSLLEEALASQSSAFELKEWKVDNVETLTAQFYAENNSPGGNPLTDWLFAKADIDGSNRISENSEPNTFNPFASEWGLEFDTASSFHGGKPIGTQTGSNYGSGIMEIGFLKPEILNGNLTSKKGAFFIDIDYSKSLKVVFDVAINIDSTNVFDNPKSYRRYTIFWDANTCTKKYFWYNLGPMYVPKVSVIEDGFLYGLTDGVVETTSLPCDGQFSYEGESGTFQIVMNFGTGVGVAGIDYNAYNKPDKFDILWNGNSYSSGYVGNSIYDAQLLSMGIPKNEIKTGNPSTGKGSLLFPKNLPTPTTAILRITAPLRQTQWDVQGVCPEIRDFTDIGWEDTGRKNDRTGSLSSIVIVKGEDLIEVTEKVWETYNGEVWAESPVEVSETNTFELLPGLNKFRIKALNASSEIVYSNELKYSRI